MATANGGLLSNYEGRNLKQRRNYKLYENRVENGQRFKSYGVLQCVFGRVVFDVTNCRLSFV
jgi:hypothetical protein